MNVSLNEFKKDPVPEKRSEVILFRVPPTVKGIFQQLCDKRNRNMSEVLNYMINSYIVDEVEKRQKIRDKVGKQAKAKEGLDELDAIFES